MSIDLGKTWVKISLAAAAAAGTGILLWKLAEDGKVQQADERMLTLQEIIDVMRALQIDMHGAFLTLAGFSQSIKEQTRNLVSKEDMKDIIRLKSPYLQIVKNTQDRIYQKYDVTERQVRKALKQYKKEAQLQEIIQEMKVTQEDAYSGKPPKPKIQIPPQLTMEKFKEIYDEWLKQSREQMSVILDELHQKGVKITKQSSEVNRALQDIRSDSIKEDLIKEVVPNHENPLRLFNLALQKYMEESKQFRISIDMLEREHQIQKQILIESKNKPQEVEEEKQTQDSENKNVAPETPENENP